MQNEKEVPVCVCVCVCVCMHVYVFEWRSQQAEEMRAKLGGRWTMKVTFKTLVLTLNLMEILKGIWGKKE